MEHSNAARTLHQPTAELLQALAADAVLSGSSQDMAHALSRLSVPPVEAIVSAARVSDSGRAHALLGDVAKTKPQWLSVEDEHGDSPSRVAARRLDHKSLSLLFRHDVPATHLLDLVNSYPHAATAQSQEAARATRKAIVRALESQGADLDGAVGTAMAQALANDDALGALELCRLHKVPPSTRLTGTFIQAKIPDGDHAPVFLTDTISILVESGASLSVRNNQGKPPLDLAVDAGLPSSVLRQLGATIPKKKPVP